MGFRREHKTTQNKIQKKWKFNSTSPPTRAKRGGSMAKLILKYFSVLAIPVEEKKLKNTFVIIILLVIQITLKPSTEFVVQYFAFTAGWDWGILLLKFLYQTLLFDGSKALLFSEPLEWHSISSRAFFSWRLTIRLSNSSHRSLFAPSNVCCCHRHPLPPFHLTATW